MSRKLTGSQRNWVPREQETYAIILALQKWETWIGFQPVLVLTDHKALESWAKGSFGYSKWSSRPTVALAPNLF
jgi:hypothetical protein